MMTVPSLVNLRHQTLGSTNVADFEEDVISSGEEDEYSMANLKEQAGVVREQVRPLQL